MKLVIKDKKLGNENYQYNVWVNEKKVNVQKMKHGNEVWAECPENSSIRVEVENIFFCERKIYLYFIFYWIVSCLCGMGEQSPFGYPYNALITINNIGQNDIFLETNSIWKKEAFKVNSECDVIQNIFYSPKGYKKRWFCGFALPISLLIFALLVVIVLMGWKEEYFLIKWIFTIGFSFAEFVWCVYVAKILSIR